MNGLIAQYGLPAVFLNVLVQQIGVPLPSGPMLIVCGASIAEGRLSLLQVFATALLGCLIADAALYMLGRKFGSRMSNLLRRRSKRRRSYLDRMQSRFVRLGGTGILLGRLVPGLSLATAPMAGAARIPYWNFALFDAIGSAFVVAVPIGIGMIFYRSVDEALMKLHAVNVCAGAVVAVCIVLLALTARLLIRRLRRRPPSGVAPASSLPTFRCR